MIGVAVGGDAPSDEFRRALEEFRTDRQAGHNYSVWLSADPRVFQRLQWGGCTVVRTRDPNRFGRAVAFHLSGHGAPPGVLLRTDGVVAVHDGRATVLPGSFRQQIPTHESPLRAAGIVLHDAPWVDFDPSSGEVVLQPPPLAGRFGDMIARLPAARRSDPVTEFGRYPLAGWYIASQPGAGKDVSITDAVAAVLSGLRAPVAEEDQLTAVAAMFERIPLQRLRSATPTGLIDDLRA